MRHEAAVIRTLLAAVCTFMNVPALMTVAPLVAQTTSGNAADAGLVTALFSGSTVVGELLMPTLLARFRPGRLFAVALLLIGGGSLAHVALDTSVAGILALAAVRGLGFGTAVVTGAVLVTELAPSGARGRAVGNLGLAIGGASMISPSLGLLMLGSLGPRAVFTLAGAVALLGVLCVDGVDRGIARPVSRPVQVITGLRRRALLIPVLALALLTMTYGGLVSFGPSILDPVGWGSAASFFFVYGVGRAGARWWGGRAADRWGHRAVIVPGMALAVVGLFVLTFGAHAQPLLVGLAALLYGAGAGMAQSAALLGMLLRVPHAEVPLVSTLWNMAYDGGVSVGGAVLGVLAVAAGVTAVLWALPLLSGCGLLLFAADFQSRAPRLEPSGGEL
jgi:predicted MFS family arabinose efflux permease